MMTHHKTVKVEIFFQGDCGSDPGESSLRSSRCRLTTILVHSPCTDDDYISRFFRFWSKSVRGLHFRLRHSVKKGNLNTPRLELLKCCAYTLAYTSYFSLADVLYCAVQYYAASVWAPKIKRIVHLQGASRHTEQTLTGYHTKCYKKKTTRVVSTDMEWDNGAKGMRLGGDHPF